MNGIFQQFSSLVEESVIHAPGIHADARKGRAIFACRSRQSALDFREKVQNVPSKASERPYRSVGEPMDLLERQPFAVVLSRNDASAFRPQINRQKNSIRIHDSFP